MRWLRLKLWLTAPLACKFGRHVEREGYWSYGFGILTYHCVNCEKGIRKIPLDDTSEEAQQRIQQVTGFIEEQLDKDQSSGG